MAHQVTDPSSLSNSLAHLTLSPSPPTTTLRILRSNPRTIYNRSPSPSISPLTIAPPSFPVPEERHEIFSLTIPTSIARRSSLLSQMLDIAGPDSNETLDLSEMIGTLSPGSLQDFVTYVETGRFPFNQEIMEDWGYVVEVREYEMEIERVMEFGRLMDYLGVEALGVEGECRDLVVRLGERMEVEEGRQQVIEEVMEMMELEMQDEDVDVEVVRELAMHENFG